MEIVNNQAFAYFLLMILLLALGTVAAGAMFSQAKVDAYFDKENCRNFWVGAMPNPEQAKKARKIRVVWAIIYMIPTLMLYLLMVGLDVYRLYCTAFGIEFP